VQGHEPRSGLRGKEGHDPVRKSKGAADYRARISLPRHQVELCEARSAARGYDASGNRHTVDVGLRKIVAPK
jgi:hypothetical protein